MKKYVYAISSYCRTSKGVLCRYNTKCRKCKDQKGKLTSGLSLKIFYFDTTEKKLSLETKRLSTENYGDVAMSLNSSNNTIIVDHDFRRICSYSERLEIVRENGQRRRCKASTGNSSSSDFRALRNVPKTICRKRKRERRSRLYLAAVRLVRIYNNDETVFDECPRRPRQKNLRTT